MGSRLLQNSEAVRKRIQSHTFDNEGGDEYEGSKFGGFPEYFRRKKIKLQNRDAELRATSHKPQIFRGIVAHVNGYTQPSLNDLHDLIITHGGGFMQYLDGKTTVTHIIASNLTPKKAVEFRRYRIVKPAWIVDSVNAGKLLPWDSYKVIDEGHGQRLLGFNDGQVVSHANTQQRTYREQSDTSWYTSQVKAVAEDIDNEDGAQFPSTQQIAYNGTSAYMGDSTIKPKRWSQSNALDMEDEQDSKLNSSANFEVTSSLEDAMNTAAAVVEPTITTPTTLLRRQISAGASPTSRQPQSPRSSPTPAKPRAKRYESDDTKQIGFQSPTRVQPRGASPMTEDEDESPTKPAKVLTAEEHNAILLADPHMRKSSTANPDFIKQYYSESRLHHLSMWKADLKARFQQLASEQSLSQKRNSKRRPGSRRYVMHVDFDSFFCAISLLDAPEYKDKPTVVAHGSGPGNEIASCNYPARAFGVKNGMWMKKALELCTDIKVLPYNFPAYEEASKHFYECILEIGGVVQSVSIDEALVDITAQCIAAGETDGVGISEGSIWREQEKADQIATNLRARIKETTGCEVSIGIGGNILLAKVALRKAKPAGQYQIKPEEVLEFLGGLSLQDLPGVAFSIGGKLEEIGVKLVKDVRELSKERLMTVLGPKTGEKIWDYSRGIDRVEVGEQVVRKSVSAEVNWGIRFISQPEAEEFVMNLCKELQKRLLEQRVRGRQLTMKIMRRSADAPLDPPKNLGHGKCDTFNKSVVLGVPTNNSDIIGKEAVSILRGYGFSPGELRGLGVQMQKLEPLKVPSNALPDGSQRKINFGTTSVPKLAKQLTEDPIDDVEPPLNARSADPPRPNERAMSSHIQSVDVLTPRKATRFSGKAESIDDIESPQKTKDTPMHPAIAIARANALDSSARKVLNLTGTQFIIPTQLDPSVLAELPTDIRSKLLAQQRSQPTSRSESPAIQSRSRSPSVIHDDILPSQLDPEVFAALPEDMKAEVLASYKSHPHGLRASTKAQAVLPQSPRKSRIAPSVPKPRWTPTKRRGRPAGSRNKATLEADSRYKQSSFISSKAKVAPQTFDDSAPPADGPLDEEFLAALPEDVRVELLAEHRRTRLMKKGVLLSTSNPTRKKNTASDPQYQRKLRLPPRESRPTFTTMELSSLPELRETLSIWFKEFRDDGPHEGDVGAIERYFRRVVVEERDIGKVVSVVRWLEWLLNEGVEAAKEGHLNDDGDDEIDDNDDGLRAWGKALQGIKEKVQEAVLERGLGRIDI